MYAENEKNSSDVSPPSKSNNSSIKYSSIMHSRIIELVSYFNNMNLFAHKP